MSGKRVTVDVKRNDDGHIKTQYSCIASYTFKKKMNISLIMSECMKVNLYQKVDILCIWCAVGLCRTYANTNITLNLQFSLNEKSHLLDKCDMSIKN